MLFKDVDFENIDIKQSLTLRENTHVSTWEHYLNCYSSSIKCIFEKDLLPQYIYNSKARGILFLLRHTFELTIKKNMHLQNIKISNSHDYSILLTNLKTKIIVPTEFETAINFINKDSTGECFRYFSNEYGLPFFTFHDKIELVDLITAYNSINSYPFQIENLFPITEYEMKNIKWNLTFHLGEATGLGHVKTQFDQTIEFLLDRILKREIDINLIYLPLLSMIRNSIEIGLKFNIQLAKEMFITESNLSIGKEHSLAKLYNIFGDSTGYLSRIDIEKIKLYFKKEHNKYLKEFRSLYNVVNKLDKSSYLLRFPVDTNNNPYTIQFNRDSVLTILKLYYSTNSFFTFINEVLYESGFE